jgi:PAS domain-containing protein
VDDPEFAEALLRSVGTPLLACDASGRIVFGNESLRALFGPGSEQVSLTGWLQR